jgi:hypothetical protein
MSDITLLGVLAAGLGVYCLYLQMKFKFLMDTFQLVLMGLYEGEAEIEKRGNVYFPVPKSKT